MTSNKAFLKFRKLVSMPGINDSTITNIKKLTGLNLRNNFENIKIKSLAKTKRLLNSTNKLGKALISQTKENLDFLSKIKTYRGLRNKFGYPSRGQRTHTNGKTKKKLQKKKQL